MTMEVDWAGVLSSDWLRRFDQHVDGARRDGELTPGLVVDRHAVGRRLAVAAEQDAGFYLLALVVRASALRPSRRRSSQGVTWRVTSATGEPAEAAFQLSRPSD